MAKAKTKNARWSILICTVLLLAIGLTALYSATISSELVEFKKQIIWLALSMPIFLCAYFIDYRVIAKIALPLYIISIVLLALVLLTGAINGASSWFSLGSFSLQPGEFSKITVILYLAVIMDKISRKSSKAINKPLNLLKVLAIAALPILLIAMEPDYGTAMAYILALVMMLFVSGINKKYIFAAIILVIVLVPTLYFFVLPEHAKDRINVYLNPYTDPRGAGYNIIQSKLAIGAGRLLGQGYLKGPQTHLGFLYPKSTDFIFSVIGEEFGFIVCAVTVIIYITLIVLSISVAKTAEDDLGSYLAIGLTGILLFHILENIGMTIGLLPITGVPLPFISYGGSALITDMAIIGLILNVSDRYRRSIFQ